MWEGRGCNLESEFLHWTPGSSSYLAVYLWADQLASPSLGFILCKMKYFSMVVSNKYNRVGKKNLGHDLRCKFSLNPRH